MLSHKELGITKKEKNALLWVRYMLDTKAIKKNMFDMSDPASSDDVCGTACCIGGWAKLHMLGIQSNEDGEYFLTSSEVREIQNYVYDAEEGASPLEALFYPYDIDDWDGIKPSEGSKAITNFLETGKPDWKNVVNGK